MKKFLLVFGLFLFSLPALAVRLEGGVTYTVESARKEAFDGVKYKIPVSTFSQFLVDPDFDKHQEAMGKGKSKLNNCWLVKYADGYDITYNIDKYKVYSYWQNGKLYEIGIKTSLKYPVKVYNYNLQGNLISINFLISDDECYIYDTNGKLLAYWIGKKAYDINGHLINEELD